MELSQGRQRRLTKTPKRFDDEAFETPSKASSSSSAPAHHHHPPPPPPPAPTPTTVVQVEQKPIEIEVPTKIQPTRRPTKTPKRFNEFFDKPNKPTPIQSKATPDPKQAAKSIIKVKLASKARTPQSATKSVNTSKSNKEQESDELLDVKDVKLFRDSSKETPKPKETPKAKEVIKVEKSTQKLKDVKEKQLKDIPKPKDTPKPKEVVKVDKIQKLKEIKDKLPKDTFKLKTPPIKIREIKEKHYRTKRPITPPVFADLIPNQVLPFWDARTAAEDHEDDNVKELVHCHCGVAEELGLMVQCETCLTWQHAYCLGIEKPEDAPDGYTCRACSDPKYARESMKWAYDQDWLTKGRLKQFPCDKTPLSEKRVHVLNRINTLINRVLNMLKLIHSLRVKQKTLMEASDDDQELKNFRVQWAPNYQHHDGSFFIPTVTYPSSTPASTISAIADTPDAGDIAVETVVGDAPLPDIGHLEDVSAILDSSPYATTTTQQLLIGGTTNNNTNETTPNDCKANLKLHIQQTEEFISIELSNIEEQVSNLEKDTENVKELNLGVTLDSLKNDLLTMKRYISLNKKHDG